MSRHAQVYYRDRLAGTIAELPEGGYRFTYHPDYVGEGPAMTARLVTRNASGELWTEDLFETVLPALENAPQPDHFVF